jgi:hypothetical protein
VNTIELTPGPKILLAHSGQQVLAEKTAQLESKEQQTPQGLTELTALMAQKERQV